MAHLTREQMEQVIRGGGSVKHGGRIISTVEGLPSKADLAKGDPAKERAAAGDLQAQIDQLQQQLAGLQASQGQESDQGRASQEQKQSGAPAPDEGKKGNAKS